MAQNSKEISLIRSYFEEHLKLIIHFLSVADFSQYRKDNIYSSKENALCSSYVELFELTYTLLGLNYAQSLFRRENSRLMGQQFFEGITEDWVSNELVPTLQGFPIAHLPIRFIMTLYQILMGVVHIGISVNWESLSVIL